MSGTRSRSCSPHTVTLSIYLIILPLSLQQGREFFIRFLGYNKTDTRRSNQYPTTSTYHLHDGLKLTFALHQASFCRLNNFNSPKFNKGKAFPLQAWSGPEGSRKLSFPDFMTTAKDGGEVVSLTHWPPLP